MSGEGLGKIKPKKTHAPKKPYDRSTSFLGRIKDSVKDLLIPSWLVRSSNDIEEAGRGSANPVSMLSSNEGHNGPGFYHGNESLSFRPSTSSGSDPIPHFNEMPRQSPNSATPSSVGRDDLVGEPFMNDYGPAPNVNIAALEQQNVSWRANSESPISRLTSVFQQEPKRRKTGDSARLRMSDSYLNETSDVDTALGSQIMMSTSALKKQPTKQAPRTTELWSPEGAKLRKALVPPVKDKPAFNSILFASASQPSTGSFGNSSFYSGKTCYGGSATRRKKALNKSLPYQASLPLRKQVTANKLNSSLNATTSSTAQRILETLDRMSTPLGDAKKIPQDESTNDSLISFTPSSYRRTSSLNRSITRPLQLPNRGPPTSQHQALSQATLARNRNRVTGVDRRRQDTSDSPELVLSQEISAVGEDLQRPASQELSSSPALPPSSSGKLKSKKFSQHVSNRKEDSDEVTVAPDLPTKFTLPISSIYPISFSSPPAPKSVVSTIPSRESTAAAPMQFTFSTPIEERRPSASNQSLNNSDQGFKFSSPIKASQSKLNAVGAEGGSKTSPEPAVGASSVLPSFSSSVPVPKPKVASPDIGGTSSSFKSYNKWSGFNKDSSADRSSPGGFSLAPATTLKSGSVMDILGGKTSSPVAALSPKDTDDPMAKSRKPDETPKSGVKPSTQTASPFQAKSPPKQVDDLMAKFMKPAGSLECEAQKPEAKPASPGAGPSQAKSPPKQMDDLMAKFMKPAGSWECDACMLSNKPEAVKCIACEAPKPGAASSGVADASSNSLSAMFKKPAGSWECDICMVQNTATASRCIACDAPRPGLQATGLGTESKPAEKSGPAVQFAPGGGFVINTTTAASGSSGFKFGNSSTASSTSNPAPAPTGFVFGQTTATSSAASGFKFGAPTTSEGFSFGKTTASSTATSAGFSFGKSAAITISSSMPSTSTTSIGGPDTGASSAALGISSDSVKTPFQFGSAQTSRSDSLSSVDVTAVKTLNSNTNGVSSGNTWSSTVGLGVSAAPTLTSASTPAPQINFSGSSVSAPAASSGLFQFGLKPSGSAAPATGLGMAPSLVSKPLLNGATSDAGKTTGSPLGASAFGGFGQNAFSVPSGASAVTAQTSKRQLGSEESEPSAKKSFNFTPTVSQASQNGGFHFGGVGQTSGPVFGAAAASAPAPGGGFMFGSTKAAAPQPSGPASSGGFQFASGPASSSGFNFGQAAAAPKPSFEAPASFKAGGLSTNFNFGGAGQPSAAPFQFGAKPSDSAATVPKPAVFAAPPIPQLNGPGFTAGLGSFNHGTGDTGQRKVMRAKRRIPKK